MNSVCSAQDVFFCLGNDTLLHGLSLHVKPGELLVVAGPNGAGKSTLLRLLAGLEQPSSGEIYGRPPWGAAKKPGLPAQGVSLPSLSPRERGRFLAYVPQNNKESIPFTVAETVLLGRAPWQNILGSTSPEDRRIAVEAMELLCIEGLGLRPFASLSGGEQQLALIARALCQQPTLLLLDEPTSALDYSRQLQVMDTLACLCRNTGLAVVMVAHDLNLALMYADAVLLLKGGVSLGFGSPDAFFTTPLLEQLYNCPLLVDKNPCTQTPRITLFSKFAQHKPLV